MQRVVKPPGVYLLRWAQRTPVHTFFMSPLIVIAFELALHRGGLLVSPWGIPLRNVFGWQKPCYLMSDAGYAQTYAELLETTDWSKYGQKSGNPLNSFHAPWFHLLQRSHKHLVAAKRVRPVLVDDLVSDLENGR